KMQAGVNCSNFFRHWLWVHNQLEAKNMWKMTFHITFPLLFWLLLLGARGTCKLATSSSNFFLTAGSLTPRFAENTQRENYESVTTNCRLRVYRGFTYTVCRHSILRLRYRIYRNLEHRIKLYSLTYSTG